MRLGRYNYIRLLGCNLISSRQYEINLKLKVDVRRSGGIIPRVLNLGNRWMRMLALHMRKASLMVIAKEAGEINLLEPEFYI